MTKQPYADIPGHEKLDATLRSAASGLQRSAADLRKKAGQRKHASQAESFRAMADDAERLVGEVKAIRHRLWESAM